MTGEMDSAFGFMRIETVEVPSPWEAWLLPVPAFPLPQEQQDQLLSYQHTLNQLRTRLTGEMQLQHNVVLQTWKLSSAIGLPLLEQHQQDWPFDLGLGVWPDRLPPQTWSGDSIQDAAAAVYRGEEPALPFHRLLHLTAEARPCMDAASQMQGLGAQIELFSTAPITQIAETGKQVLLPMIVERRFRKSELYLPLLDRNTLRHPEAAKHLTEWLCNIDVYLRESAEDKGVLLLSRISLEKLLEPAKQTSRTIMSNS